MVLFLPFSGHALTSQTTRNAIQGSAPYLTFDGGRTRVVNTNGLLRITLSDGTKYTPSTNPSSSSRPIVLPVAGQSFADIRMLVPTDTNSVALSYLIGSPYNYWGDDDGDANVTATGSLSLSIVDKYNQAVSRSTVPTICKAPYKVTLSSTSGTLSTRYGFPNRSNFSASSVTYYVNPKAAPVVCFARPNLMFGNQGDNPSRPSHNYAGPSWMWSPYYGFIPQSTDPSRYGQNFPTTGANGLYFDLEIGGGGSLSWSPVSHGGITATMTNSTAASVRVTLTGPFATRSQINSDNPGRLSTLILPQTFELVGRDSSGRPIVKYGFTLKQWFVNRGSKRDSHYYQLSWCNSIGYRLPKVKDLTNSVRTNPAISGATPSSHGNNYMRHVGAGFFAEWGRMQNYSGVGFTDFYYWTSDPNPNIARSQIVVRILDGDVGWDYTYNDLYGLCAYP